MTKLSSNIKLRELTNEELDQVSGAGTADVYPPRSLFGDEIGVPLKLRRPIKGMESIEDDE